MKALILLNLQVDFTAMGALPHEQPEGLVQRVNALMDDFDLVLAAMHWHPAEHVSFAAMHPWRKPGQVIEHLGQDVELQVMHAVQGSMGAMLIPGIDAKRIQHYCYMGTEADIDTHSCFFDQAQARDTGLQALLHDKQVQQVGFAGINVAHALENSIADALAAGYDADLYIF